MHDVPCALERRQLRAQSVAIIPDLALQLLARGQLVFIASRCRVRSRFKRSI